MKYTNNVLSECTEKELYGIWLQTRAWLNDISYDDYLALAINSGVEVTERFVVIYDNEEVQNL